MDQNECLNQNLNTKTADGFDFTNQLPRQQR